MPQKSLFLALLMALLIVPATVQASVSTFDSSRDGFSATYYNVSSNSFTENTNIWSSTGGNSGGYISGSLFNDVTKGFYGFSNYTSAKYGNLTGQTLTTDFKIDGAVAAPAGYSVRFYIGSYTSGYNYWVTKDAYAWNPNSDTSWTTHTVSMDSSNWVAWPNQNAGSMTWAQILASYNDIGLVFADGSGNFTNNNYLSFKGSGTIGIDNFGAVPLPPAVWLLGSGLIGLVAMRRRFKK